jgi:hypothetical protein
MKNLTQAMKNSDLSEELRTFSLYKKDGYTGYGIAFHTESIQPTKPNHKLVYPLIEIEPNSPADDAGMKNGQRVVAVNGEFINSELFCLDDVVESIENSYFRRNFTDITVLDAKEWSDFMENPQLAIKLALSHPPPKLPKQIRYF